MNMKLGTLLCGIMMLMATWAKAQVLEARVDNPTVPLGEVFNLNISFEGENDNNLQPDLRELNKDFSVYSSSQSTQINFINGVKSVRQDWDIGLIAKREGKVTIPAIKAGKYQTNPLIIDVKPAGTKVDNDLKNVKNDNTLVQATNFETDLQIDVKNPYVQQEVNAILTIKDNVGLQLTAEPRFVSSDGWIIKPLGQPKVIQGKEKSRDIKFYYAMFPQKSGNLTVPAINIEGYYVTFEPTMRRPLMNSRGLHGFFQIIDEGFDNMLGTQRPVSLYTKPLDIKVKPAVNEFSEYWWLPASSLELSAIWEAKKPLFKVGETVTREITLKASGVADTQLPELIFSDTEAFKQYPENPQLSSTVVGDEIVSQAVVRVVYIPQKGGENVLPEIKLPWFNVVSGKMQTAVIPAEKIFVQESVMPTKQNKVESDESKNFSTSKQSGNLQNNNLQVVKNEAVSQTKYNQQLNLWVIVFAIIGAFILGVAVSYLLLRNRKSNDGDMKASKWLSIIHDNLNNKDYRALRDSLLKWGNASFPDKNITNLNDLSEILQDKNFAKQMDLLNSILYAGATIPLNSLHILPILKSANIKSKKMKSVPLPDLYL